ncbi:MAG TPA: OmpA family protein [Burkholderiales bacterium]|nr:OmpA family protein [Burkholderiales bacterium]
MNNAVRSAFAASLLFVAACASRQPAPPPPAPAPEVTAPKPEVAPAAVEAPAPKALPEKVTLQADALFDFDKSAIRADAQGRLDDVVAKAKGVSVETINVVGYTDSTGPDAYNMKLSQRRAASVKDYLVKHGVSAGRVHTEGKGKASPVADNKTREGRQKNRRAEIEVLGTR